MSESDSHNLPPCPLSSECLRFVDELDTTDQPGVVPLHAPNDERDARLLAELRSHIPTCPTCTAALAQARHMRQQQRSALRGLLLEGESVVPSTVASIMHSIAREPRSMPAATNHHQDISTAPTLHLEEPHIISPQERRRPGAGRAGAGIESGRTAGAGRQGRNVAREPSARKTRTALLNVFSLAMVAVIILSVIVILSQFIAPRLGPLNRSQPTPTVVAGGVGWNSAVIGLSYPGADGSPGRITIANYAPASGQSTLLVPFQPPASTQLDMISHDGLHLLYQYTLNGHVYYYTAPTTSNSSFYSLSSNDGGNAIWLDNNSALIASKSQGVIQVDTQTGAAKTVLASIKGIRLLIYRAPYLYFVAESGTGLTPGALYRVTLSGGSAVQVAPPALPGSTFWISPDGTAVFYESDGPQGQGIYVAQSDGSNPRLLRSGYAIPIGYAADNALMLLQEVNGKFQVVKLGATPQQAETVVMPDAAPGAVSLCDASEQNGGTPICADNAALAPGGSGLILHAYYADGSSQVIYDDLAKGKSRVLVALAKQQIGVQLPGWDQIAVPGAPLSSPTPTASTGWNSVVIVTTDASDQKTIANYNYLNGHSALLVPRNLPPDTRFDGVSSDGQNLLYQFSSSGHMLYWTLKSLPGTGFFYELNNADAGNAIWLNTHTVLISLLNGGVEQVDVNSGQAQELLSGVQVGELVFYYAPYLYFVGGANLATGALYRVNLSGGTPQQITMRSPGTTFWHSIDGGTIYYVNTGSAGQPGLYAVDSDGNNPRLLRSSGIPVGFAPDSSLMVMRDDNGVFRLYKLGATPQDDVLILDNVAPNAVALCDSSVSPGVTPMCDSSIALAPYSHALLVEAYYADGTRKVYSYDLAQGNQTVLFTVKPGAQVNLPGWDTMAVK
jgi:hypothetical protein